MATGILDNFGAWVHFSDMASKESEPLSERIITPMTPTMLRAIEDYRFDSRTASRSDAIRKLIEAGLKAEAAAKAKPSK